MSISKITAIVTNKDNFLNIQNFIDFSRKYLEFTVEGLQAIIVSQNESQYRFFQYKQEANFNITRPLNSQLMYTVEDQQKIAIDFLAILSEIRDIPESDLEKRLIIIRAIYTIQQCIGAALDALPSASSNQSRKINGDLFERLIRLLVEKVGIKCKMGTIKVPIKVNEEIVFQMQYQHDLLIYDSQGLRAIGSVKTSSKDRIDKIFMDKFLYSRLTDTELPHIAIFLNDVQRKNTTKENEYSISSTFLPGRFKGFTIKLNPLDGVYYCDIRKNMQTDLILKNHIQTIDYFFCSDLWKLIENDNK